MSSILRALKKLEKEMPGDASAASADSVRLDIRNTVRKRQWRSYLLQKFSLGASVLILVFLMFWITWNKPVMFNHIHKDGQLSESKAAEKNKPFNTTERDNDLTASIPKTENRKPASENVTDVKTESGTIRKTGLPTGNKSAGNSAEVKKKAVAVMSQPPAPEKTAEFLQEKINKEETRKPPASSVAKTDIKKPSAHTVRHALGDKQTSKKTAVRSSGSSSKTNRKTDQTSQTSSSTKKAKESSPEVSEGLTDVDMLLDIVEIPEIEEKQNKKKTAASVPGNIKIKHSWKTSSPASKPIPQKKVEKVQKKKIPQPETAVAGVTEKPAYKPSQRELAYQQLPERAETETGLEIQALVWSPVLEERFTVVNGDILKIGAFIDDVSIQYIGENFVVLQKKGNRWQQKMQVR